MQDRSRLLFNHFTHRGVGTYPLRQTREACRSLSGHWAISLIKRTSIFLNSTRRLSRYCGTLGGRFRLWSPSVHDLPQCHLCPHLPLHSRLPTARRHNFPTIGDIVSSFWDYLFAIIVTSGSTASRGQCLPTYGGTVKWDAEKTTRQFNVKYFSTVEREPTLSA
jgi:hypothetical protein